MLKVGGKVGIQFYLATPFEEEIFIACIKNTGFTGYVLEHDNKRFYILGVEDKNECKNTKMSKM